MKLQLKRSSALLNGLAKEPTPGQLEYGELAINFNSADPAAYIKNSDNQVIRLSGVGKVGDYWSRTNGVLSPSNASDSISVESGIFAGSVTATGGFIGNLTGNADTATQANNSEYLRNYAPTSAATGNSIVLRDGAGNFSANVITATLNGVAAGAVQADNASGADNADNIYVERDDNSNASRFVTFVDDANARFHRLNTDASLSYNPATNTLNCNITGLSSNEVTSVAYADRAGEADTVSVSTQTSSGYKPFVFTDDIPNGGYRLLRTDSDTTVGIDPAGNAIRSPSFVGSATQVYSYDWSGTPPAGGFKIATVTGSAGANKSIYKRDDVYVSNTGAIHAPTFIGNLSGNLTSSNVSVSGQLSVSGAITSSGTITAPNFNSLSDRRVKENIQPIDDALSKVDQLNGVTFKYIDGGKSVGLIAQDLEKVYPELVHENSDQIKTVQYGNLIGLLVEAVKELKQEVTELKRQLK